MNNSHSPDLLAVVPLPVLEERKRRQRVLARLLVIALDMLLSEEHGGEP